MEIVRKGKNEIRLVANDNADTEFIFHKMLCNEWILEANSCDLDCRDSIEIAISDAELLELCLMLLQRTTEKYKDFCHKKYCDIIMKHLKG